MLQRWSMRLTCLANLVVPYPECFSGREYLDGQWGGGVRRPSQVFGRAGQGDGGGADSGGGAGGAGDVR